MLLVSGIFTASDVMSSFCSRKRLFKNHTQAATSSIDEHATVIRELVALSQTQATVIREMPEPPQISEAG